MCSFPDLVILERSLTVAAQCFGAAIHDALHMIYTCPPSLRDPGATDLKKIKTGISHHPFIVGSCEEWWRGGYINSRFARIAASPSPIIQPLRHERYAQQHA